MVLAEQLTTIKKRKMYAAIYDKENVNNEPIRSSKLVLPLAFSS